MKSIGSCLGEEMGEDDTVAMTELGRRMELTAAQFHQRLALLCRMFSSWPSFWLEFYPNFAHPR